MGYGLQFFFLPQGCTATALLIWFDQNKNCFAQCANLGDSACVMR